MKPESFESDSGTASPDNRILDLKALAEQECRAYLKKREDGRSEVYEKLKEAFENSGKICDPVKFLCNRDNLLRAIAEYLIERDKPEGEDG